VSLFLLFHFFHVFHFFYFADGSYTSAPGEASWICVTDRTAYVIFLVAVGTGLGLLTVGLMTIAVMLWRQHRRARPR